MPSFYVFFSNHYVSTTTAGQVASTRTDVLPDTFTDVLKTLTDEVPGFSGKRAKEIVGKELGRTCNEVFQEFSEEPLKAASLGQVHTAYYKGNKVAVKVQRAGLKELFDIDLKNLRKVSTRVVSARRVNAWDNRHSVSKGMTIMNKTLMPLVSFVPMICETKTKQIVGRVVG